MKHAPSHPRFQTLAAVRQKHVFKGCLSIFSAVLFFKDSCFYRLSVFFSQTLHLFSSSFCFKDSLFLSPVCLFSKTLHLFSSCFLPVCFHYLSDFFSKPIHLFSNLFFSKTRFLITCLFFCKTQTGQHWANHLEKNETFAKKVRKEILFIGMVGKEVP